MPLGQWFHGWLRRLRDECGNVRLKELSGAVTGCIVVPHCVSVTLCFALPTGACATCGVRNTSDWRGRHRQPAENGLSAHKTSC